jgi:hypothetical protein
MHGSAAHVGGNDFVCFRSDVSALLNTGTEADEAAVLMVLSKVSDDGLMNGAWRSSTCES